MQKDGTMIITLILLFALVFVNGWTDAPNAIATCVGSGAMSLKKSAFLAAVMNLLGSVCAYMYSGKVANSIMNIVSVSNEWQSSILSVSMLSVVIWAVAAWYFGIPTSESHALVSALCGSALSCSGTVDRSEIINVALGLVMSVSLGALFGAFFGMIGKRIKSKESKIRPLVIMSSAIMAFAHGAQDGQKFVGVFLLVLSNIRLNETHKEIVALMLVSLLMFFGTSLGGERIVNAVGKEMTKLNMNSAFCADLGGSLCVLLATYFGIPLSTTHSKTTAVMGVGAVTGGVETKKIYSMFFAWLLTFPCCFLLGYLLMVMVFV